jgi:Fe-S oxidoreductase
MPLSRENDYAMYLYTCNRCRSCAVEPSDEHKAVCPSYSLFGYFAYSGGGRGYVAQGIIEGKVKPSQEAAEVAMNCLMCGACMSACPPGFDINNFIRDLRDHLVSEGFYINDAHKRILDNVRVKGNPWGRKMPEAKLPAYKGQDVLLWRGCRERLDDKLMGSVRAILDAAGVSWGVIDEPCCGAPLFDLGDRSGFEKQAGKVIEAVNATGAGRMLILCPHCAAAMAVDYAMEVGDVEPEPLTLPALLAELIGDEKLPLSEGPGTMVTYHDPCRLARWLEDTDSAREVISALGLDLAEMERSEEWSWCCGSGGWASAITPELTNYAARERIKEARDTGAEAIVTACSYCTQTLGRKSGKKQRVVHLAEMVAEQINKNKDQ